MGACKVKKGIFVLKECGDFAAVKCAECGIDVCGKHARQMGAKLVCTECYAKSHQTSVRSSSGSRMGWNSNYNSADMLTWYFINRQFYYTDHNYHPFDHRDYNDFNSHQNVNLDDEGGTTGMLDS